MAREYAALHKPAAAERRQAPVPQRSTAPAQALRPRTISRAAAVPVATPLPALMQFARVSSPSDPAEREAVDAARKVLSMSELVAPTKQPDTSTLHRASVVPASGPVPVPPLSGGTPLAPGVREFMEQRLGADFSH